MDAKNAVRINGGNCLDRLKVDEQADKCISDCRLRDSRLHVALLVGVSDTWSFSDYLTEYEYEYIALFRPGSRGKRRR